MTTLHTAGIVKLVLLAVALAGAVSAVRGDELGDVTELLRAGKLGDAMSRADTYLAAKPRDPQMRFLKGIIERNAGKPSDAIATFTKLSEDYPELPEPYNNLAVLYASQSQFDKARAALEMALRADPNYATAYENLGDVYVRLAAQSYGRAAKLDATNTPLAGKLARLRELLGPLSGTVKAP